MRASGIITPAAAKGRMTMRQCRISIIVDLPDDLFAAAAVIAAMQTPYVNLLDRLTDAAAHYETLTEVDETAPKRKQGRPRGKRAAKMPFNALNPEPTDDPNDPMVTRL